MRISILRASTMEPAKPRKRTEEGGQTASSNSRSERKACPRRRDSLEVTSPSVRRRTRELGLLRPQARSADRDTLHRALYVSICPHVCCRSKINIGSRHKCEHSKRI